MYLLKKLSRIWYGGWVAVPSFLFFGSGARMQYVQSSMNFGDNGPDAMSVCFSCDRFIIAAIFIQKHPKLISKSMCQMGLLDMKRQIDVQVDLGCGGGGRWPEGKVWEPAILLGGAPAELGADVDQREGGGW